MPRVRPTEVEPSSKSSVTWADIAGVEDAAAELQEVVDFLKDPRRFSKLGARVPKGILLYGPPGTGKTLLAKAVAHASGSTFYSQSASAFVEMFAGLGAARIRKLFDRARKHAPAIVFIDELDAVGMRRSGSSFNREHDQTLNQLLVELDGFNHSDAGRDHRRLEPARGSRPGPPAPWALRPADPRGRAGPGRARGDPRRAHAREAAGGRRRPRRARAPDRRAHRRRPGQPLQRGGHLRRPRRAGADSQVRTSRTPSSASSRASSSARP